MAKLILRVMADDKFAEEAAGEIAVDIDDSALELFDGGLLQKAFKEVLDHHVDDHVEFVETRREALFKARQPPSDEEIVEKLICDDL